MFRSATTALDPDGVPYITLPCRNSEPTVHAALQRAAKEAIHEATHVFNWSARPPYPNPYLVAKEWNWFNEATAVFMEYYVLRGNLDSLRFAANWVDQPEVPLTSEPGAALAQRSKKIDGKLVRALIQLPVVVTGDCEIEDYHSLAVRDLQRGQGVGLPSGEAVARHIGIAPLTAEQIGIATTGSQGETPLWYYILREADARTGGHRLGPVGGRIVTEVLVGLIDADATSFRRNNRAWRPRKTLSELLTS